MKKQIEEQMATDEMLDLFEEHKKVIQSQATLFKKLEKENKEKIDQFIKGGYRDMHHVFVVHENGYHLRDIQGYFTYGNPQMFGHLTKKQTVQFHKHLMEKGIDMKKNFRTQQFYAQNG